MLTLKCKFISQAHSLILSESTAPLNWTTLQDLHHLMDSSDKFWIANSAFGLHRCNRNSVEVQFAEVWWAHKRHNRTWKQNCRVQPVLGILAKLIGIVLGLSAVLRSITRVICFSSPSFQCTLTEPSRTVLVGIVSVTRAELLFHAESPFYQTMDRMGQLCGNSEVVLLRCARRL